MEKPPLTYEQQLYLAGGMLIALARTLPDERIAALVSNLRERSDTYGDDPVLSELFDDLAGAVDLCRPTPR